MNQQQIMKKINGALQSTIEFHGTITKKNTLSAAKRIYGELFKNNNSTKLDELIEKYEKEINELEIEVNFSDHKPFAYRQVMRGEWRRLQNVVKDLKQLRGDK